MTRRLLAVALAAALAACQVQVVPVDMTDPRVTAGAARSCADLGLSDVRCTLLTLRATRNLDELRPGHPPVESQEFHEAGAPPAGESPIPNSQLVTAVVVFTLVDGTKVGVPVLCPRQPSGGDRACDPRIQ